MDGRQFDALVKSVAHGHSRRDVLKVLLGLGGAAAAGSALISSPTEAARRPTPTPKPPTCPGRQIPCGSGCCCPSGSDKCGAECCPTGQALCCDNACCYGTCYGEELCCEGSSVYCAAEGGCCPEDWGCCEGIGCLEPGRCCSDADCVAYADPETCAPGVCTESHICVTGPGCVEGQRCCDGVACLSEGQCCDNADCPDFTMCDAASYECVCAPKCCFCGVDDGCEGTCGCPEGMECRGGGCFSACVEGACTDGCEDCACASPYDNPGQQYCVSLLFPGGDCVSNDDCGLGAFCADDPASGETVCLYPCCFFESEENCSS